jgi:hypothetical protein
VHLQRDFTTIQSSLVGYQVTPLVIHTMERIVDALRSTPHSRAFSIIGPYGAGKSAFALFLSHYMSISPAQRRSLLATSNPAEEIVATLADAPIMLPVLISGNNSSLRQSLLHSLHLSLAGNIEDATSSPLMEKLDACITQGDVDPQTVADLVEEASHFVAARSSFAGVMMVIDELGQHLNYAAHQQSDRDLYVLQTLAEMTARSSDVPCLIITILHQAFDRYVGMAGVGQRTEWAKVQGRFVDIPFLEPEIQLLRMVGRALCPQPQADPYAAQREAWANRVGPITENLELRPGTVDEQEWFQLVAQTYPLHPTVLVALPLLFRQLAQNERSLFAFLTSYEPWSLQDYVAAGQPDSTTLPIYRLPHLYAYVEATLGPGLFARARGRRWAELAEACTLANNMGPIAQETLKVIGTLNALGQNRALRASEQCVSFALRDAPDAPQIQAAIEQLRTHQHVMYRAHRDSFVLWEGSDLDIERMVQIARHHEGDRLQVATLLQQYADVLPKVARKHSYGTGSVRQFAVRFVSIHDLPAVLDRSPESDGEIVYVVPTDDEELQAAREWVNQAERQTALRYVVVLPRQVQRLNDVLLDVVAIQHVLDHQPELEQDRIARRELASQLVEAQQALKEAIAHTYGIHHSEWWWCGKASPVRSLRQLDDLLSHVCDTVFADVPRIWNELLIRRQLSSAATKARRNLIEAMLDHGHEECLGMQGYPPERAMYESVLRAGGLHREDGSGRWQFGAPPADDPLHLQAVWQEIQDFISSTQHAPRPIVELYERLMAPPYGVKAGVLPVLFVTAYLEQAGEIALYQHGSYVPVPDIAIFEMLLKHPKYFAIRQSRVTGLRVAVYERLARLIAPGALEQKVQPALLDAVTPLLRLVHNLPVYSRSTEVVSEQTSNIRRCIVAAQSPDELLFTALPQACGLEPFDDATLTLADMEDFFARLQESLIELQNAYSSLIERATDYIRESFGARSDSMGELQQELAQRYQQIATATSDSQIRAFGVRVENGTPDNGWIESVGLLVQRKAMKSWHDSDTDEFALRIADLGRRFCEIEQIAVAVQGVPATTAMVRIGLTDAQGEKSMIFPAMPPDPSMQACKQEVVQTLENYENLTGEQKMVVLKGVLDGFLSRVERRNV